MRRSLQEGLLLFWRLKRINEYYLAQMRKVVIPTHLDDLVNLLCLLHHDALTLKLEQGKCFEISHVL